MGLDMYLYQKETSEIAYWRKANAIHGWIISNSGAVDDCTPIHISKNTLIQLRDDCKKVVEEADALHNAGYPNIPEPGDPTDAGLDGA